MRRTAVSEPPHLELPHTEPGGPFVEVGDGDLVLRKRSVSEMHNNVYLIGCGRTGESLIVDAADDAPLIRSLAEGYRPLAVVQTHGHWDHVRAWDALREDPGLEVWGHQGDLDLYPRAPDRLLSDGQTIAVGSLTVEVLHLPGHTPGSLLFFVSGATEHWLVTGDTLFPGGPGNTFGDAAAHARIMDGLERQVFARFGDRTRVLPGHGDTTTLGRERPDLGEWRRRGW
jgi:glyoxylase-like metal-dependent hydrolase (beta-lactamase superfamily II)